MKKCPTCQKTFDDNMRFCQTDGTPLVEATQPPDPYATMVASKDEIAAAIPPSEPSSQFSSPPPPAADDDLLDISSGANDPMKTSVVTAAEMREMAIGKDLEEENSSAPFDADKTFIVNSKPETPDFSSPSPSSLPKFDEPKLDPPTFGDSPFSKLKTEPPDFNKTSFSEPPEKMPDSPFSSPIPSPFGEKMPPSYNAPSTPPFAPPEFVKEEIKAEALNTPFADEVAGGNRQMAQSDWTPPASPSSGFGEPTSAGNPPNAAAAGQSKTLAIVSLVLGILSIPCCGFIILGIGAVVTGFMAKSKADNNPNEYGGRTFALIGLGLGALTTIIGIITNLLALLGVIPIPNF